MQTVPAFDLKLLPSGSALTCRSDQTLLDACIQIGLPVPYNCRSGECGACMAKLNSGQVQELPGADPAIFNDRHRARGNILTCLCFPKSDIVLDLALIETESASIRPTTVDTIVRRVDKLTPTIYRITVETPRPVEFHAGQCFEWVVPGVAPNRTFSTANRPGTDSIDFHVRIYPGGKIGTFVSRMSSGGTLQLLGPFGHFGLSSNSWRPAVCVAGGTGLAPIMSVLDKAFHVKDTRPIHLLYGARSRDELYCSRILRDWVRSVPSFTYTPVLSEEPADSGWSGRRGLVTDVMMEHLGDVFGLEAYVCGPPAMIDAAVSGLERAGVLEGDVRTDRFVQAKS
ncbi:MAG: 2Fe-2S iron-sulfur cluster binding domain-containing protein [Proteobacteria bacterium]|nr:2Fe-2S iron-sulfur cluster binding domain-containing protein [Pseudomonadota bacterium]